MTGQLFTHYFLTDGIRATPEWQASAADPETFAAFRESVLRRYETLARSTEPNELKTGATIRSLIAVPSQSEGTDRLSATTNRHFATR